MKRPNTTRSRRVMNYGTGDLFNFHGAFTEKAAAVTKEAETPGAFIKTVWYRGGPRYGVLTKNPKGKRNAEWGTYENGVFHPWTRRPKTRKKKAVRRRTNPGYPTAQLAIDAARRGMKRGSRHPRYIARKDGQWQLVNMRAVEGATHYVVTPDGKAKLEQGWLSSKSFFPSASEQTVRSARVVNSRRKAKKNSVTWGGKRKNTVAWGKHDTDFMRQALHELYPGKKLADVIKDPQQFSKLARRADELKREAKKQNPVMKVPGGWRGRSPKGRLSPVFPDRRDAEIFAESLQNPLRRRNFQERVIEGSRMALIMANEPTGPFRIVLFVNNGETATTATGKAKTLAGARKIAKKLLDRHIRGNPRGHARRRNYADATDLYTKFHGRGPKNVKETGIPTADYGDHPELGQLGKLVSLTFGDKDAEKPWTKKLIWESREAPDLAAEPGGRQLYIIGGGQNLNGSLAGLPIDTEKDMLDLGFAYQIEYFSQKSFDNFQPVTYYHDLGEETGECPRVVYDRIKKRLHIVGGAYVVKPEGIVN